MPVTQLDYPKAKLAIEVNNPLEERYRAGACAKEPWTLAFIEALPVPAVFWDIGANVGGYSLIAAHRGLDVVAVEPCFFNYSTLCRNLAMNGLLEKTITICAALGEAGRFDWLHYTDTRSGSSLHVLGGTRKITFQRQMVPVITWDCLLPKLPVGDEPHYAKIDVDGGELAVLKGATQALQRLSGLIIEMQTASEQTVTDYLIAAGYHLTQRFAERGGKPLDGMVYGYFERA